MASGCTIEDQSERNPTYQHRRQNRFLQKMRQRGITHGVPSKESGTVSGRCGVQSRSLVAQKPSKIRTHDEASRGHCRQR